MLKGFKKGNKYRFKKGEHSSPKTEFKKGEFIGKKHFAWKGDKVGYHASHKWVQMYKKRPNYCEMCGVTNKRFNWCNIDHKYRRVLDDYINLCAKCHKKHDLGKGLYIQTNQYTKK